MPKTKTAVANQNEGEQPETDFSDAPLPATNFDDAPLPMPPGVGEEPPAPVVQQTPYALAISYQIGNSRVEHQVIDLPFEDVETVDQFNAVINAISQANRGMRVTPLLMKMLRK